MKRAARNWPSTQSKQIASQRETPQQCIWQDISNLRNHLKKRWNNDRYGGVYQILGCRRSSICHYLRTFIGVSQPLRSSYDCGYRSALIHRISLITSNWLSDLDTNSRICARHIWNTCACRKPVFGSGGIQQY